MARRYCSIREKCWELVNCKHHKASERLCHFHQNIYQTIYLVSHFTATVHPQKVPDQVIICKQKYINKNTLISDAKYS